jgi:hypothetical protein
VPCLRYRASIDIFEIVDAQPGRPLPSVGGSVGGHEAPGGQARHGAPDLGPSPAPGPPRVSSSGTAGAGQLPASGVYRSTCWGALTTSPPVASPPPSFPYWALQGIHRPAVVPVGSSGLSTTAPPFVRHLSAAASGSCSFCPLVTSSPGVASATPLLVPVFPSTPQSRWWSRLLLLPHLLRLQPPLYFTRRPRLPRLSPHPR